MLVHQLTVNSVSQIGRDVYCAADLLTIGHAVVDQDDDERADARDRELNDASLVGMTPEEHAAWKASESGKTGKSGQDGKVSVI
jgi:hypothetical protein